MDNFLERLGDLNPQLLREIKGKLTKRNIILVICLSAIVQIFMASWGYDYYYFMNSLGIFALLIVGTYNIVADIIKEEKNGTLDFIRLAPRSASNIIIGKILGVPILLYFFIASVLPLHFITSIKTGIPLLSLIVWYLIIFISCIFFYSAAMLFFGLVQFGIKDNNSNSKAFLASSVVVLFSSIGYLNSYSYTGNAFSWLILFYPNNLFSSLGIYSDSLSFYGISLSGKPAIGIAFILFNYGLWIYWIWQGLKRRFRNPNSTLFSKKQSYFISASFIFMAVGFSVTTDSKYELSINFAILQIVLLLLFFGLTAALNQDRQTLQDWSRYRHQNTERCSLIEDLIWGEKSPATVAIAINLLITVGYSLISILLSPLEEYKISTFVGFLLMILVVVRIAINWQLNLFKSKNQQKTIIALSKNVGFWFFFGILFYMIFGGGGNWLTLSLILPIAAIANLNAFTISLSILINLIAIGLGTLQLTEELQKAGESETKRLFSS